MSLGSISSPKVEESGTILLALAKLIDLSFSVGLILVNFGGKSESVYSLLDYRTY
jgi:hypothetical protein